MSTRLLIDLACAPFAAAVRRRKICQMSNESQTTERADQELEELVIKLPKLALFQASAIELCAVKWECRHRLNNLHNLLWVVRLIDVSPIGI
jgi:hypothetical protein